MAMMIGKMTSEKMTQRQLALGTSSDSLSDGSPSFSLYLVIIVRQYPIQEFVWDREFARYIHHKNSLEHDTLSVWGVHIMQHILTDDR